MMATGRLADRLAHAAKLMRETLKCILQSDLTFTVNKPAMFDSRKEFGYEDTRPSDTI